MFARRSLLLSVALHVLGAMVLSWVTFTSSPGWEDQFDVDLLQVQPHVPRKRVPVRRPLIQPDEPTAVRTASNASSQIPSPTPVVTNFTTAVRLPLSSQGRLQPPGPVSERTGSVPRNHSPVRLHDLRMVAPALRFDRPAVSASFPSLLGARPIGIASLLDTITTPSLDAFPSADLLAQIRQRIEKERTYPRWAREAGYEGEVEVSFEIRKDGSLASVEVVRSSGYRLLDEAALKAIQRAAPFPALNTASLHLQLTVRFSLDDRAS